MECRISIRRYRRSFVTPLRTARGDWSFREGFIVQADDGRRCHYGEVAPLPEFGTESLAEAEAFLREIGKHPGLKVPPELPCCGFGLSAAIHGAVFPEACELPPVAGLLPAGPALIEAAEAKRQSGTGVFKWKVGVLTPQEEQGLFRELLGRLSPDVRLRLDANASLSPAELDSWLSCLQDYRSRIEFFEQPLPVGMEPVMARAAAASGVPIALDESLNGLQAERWLHPGAWAGPLVIKAPLMGDILRLRERLRPVAQQVVFSSVFETAVGCANVLGLARGLSPLKYAFGFDTQNAFDDSLGFPGPVAGSAASVVPPDIAQIWKQLRPLT
ncbi:o-succinylbenzoate synthase [Coraliomargarita parva]|uniref:o-succinylbenzoate synthase n=1 Tax=Coraliomargarita parva TaxID=3014050 RepID=UPI0022B516AE|nr:o-succinylbenzoate synthase [Coraliomargarita parva]